MRFEGKTAERGFTLLELLVSLAISGILTAIAIPHYREYKQRAYDARAQSDLRNVAVAEEAYYIDHEEYLSCAGSACSSLPGIAAISPGVTLSVAAREDGFSGEARHTKGSGRVFRWDSERGGLLE